MDKELKDLQDTIMNLQDSIQELDDYEDKEDEGFEEFLETQKKIFLWLLGLAQCICGRIHFRRYRPLLF